jgi:hypothetical protein
MATELDLNDDTLQQDDNSQQQDTQNNDTQDVGKQQEQASSWLDKQLGEFQENTDDERGKAAADKNKKGAQETDEQRDTRIAKERGGKQNEQQRDGRGTQQDNRVQQTTSQTPRQFGSHFRTNQRGDVVDVNGAVIAKSGGERAVFHKLWPMMDRAYTEAATNAQKIKTYEEANALAKTAGLNINEQAAGMSFMVQWKKDPKAAIKTMLSLAQEGAIDVSDIVQGGGGFNQSAVMEAINGLLEQKLAAFAPILQQYANQEQEQVIQGEVQQQYAEFIERFPDAKTHEDSIANVMRDKDVDHQTAYFITRTWAAENGLDWSKPLAPQALALQQKNGQQQQRPSGGGNNRQMPNMRNGRQQSNVDTDTKKTVFADPNDSWEQIARQTLAEHGRTVQ